MFGQHNIAFETIVPIEDDRDGERRPRRQHAVPQFVMLEEVEPDQSALTFAKPLTSVG